MTRTKSTIRKGLSLLEVMLAIVILGGALVMIGQLIRIGNRSAQNAQLISQAQILCDAKLAEISAGVLPLESVNESPIDEAPEWAYSVEVSNATQVGLLSVTVNVYLIGSDRYGRSCRLTRFLPDPNYDPYAPEG